jgi:5S rRNA maturation endonuclease (ribonuclease M5)
MNAAEIARNLHGRKLPSGWVAHCPAHDDHDPSLSLKDADDGRVLVKCHAGCQQDAVVGALKARGLWPERAGHGRVIVVTYDYRDEIGRLLYQVVRTQPKGFFQRRPDGCGGWINRKGGRQVLYRLPEVREAAIVFCVEGERDAETLRSHGFVATTNAGGAEAPWLPQYTEALRGREVILIPDNDAAGRKRVARIARALLHNVERLVILELEDGKDVTDWFARGHSEVELMDQLDGEGVAR